jgi:hypothetical protein
MKYIVNKTHAKRVGLGTYKAGQIVDAKDMEDPHEKLKPILLKNGEVLRESLISEYIEKEEKPKIETKEEKKTPTTKKKRGRRPRIKKDEKLTDSFLTD